MEYYSSLDASQLDSETPTLFEIISANQLESLLLPSLRYILVHYAQKYPGKLLKFANRFDELNFLLRTFIEWYFFEYWQGSFTENFYGLKRVSQTPLSNTKYNSLRLTQLVPSMIEERRRLSSFQMWASILETTGVSYLSEKCNYAYDVLYSKYITNQLDVKQGINGAQQREIWLKRKFVEIYPYIQTAWRAGNLATTLMYLSGSSKSSTLITFLLKINFSRLNQYDYQKNEPPLSIPLNKLPSRVSPPDVLERTVNFLIRNFTRPSWKVIRYLMGTFFPLAIFTLKFLEWWNNSDFAHKVAKSQSNALEGNIPPPSSLSKFSELKRRSKKFYRSGNACPLCKQEILNPAIIETGYVFCYTCIYNYLRDSHKLVSQKSKEVLESSSDESDDNTEDEYENRSGSESYSQAKHSKKKSHSKEIDILKGGRCPITGKKLLACKYNTLTGEYDVDGIRRLIF